MESLNLLRYLVLRDNILRKAVSQTNLTPTVILATMATILVTAKAKQFFLILSGRGVGRSMQAQRQISYNPTCVHHLIKKLLLCRSEITERGAKTKSKRWEWAAWLTNGKPFPIEKSSFYTHRGHRCRQSYETGQKHKSETGERATHPSRGAAPGRES